MSPFAPRKSALSRSRSVRWLAYPLLLIAVARIANPSTAAAACGFPALPKRADSTTDIDTSLQLAVAWLFAQQGKDGGWHSVAYGSQRVGASDTALILYALSHDPRLIPKFRRKDVDRAFAFLRRGVAKKGFVVAPDGTLDYPLYSTATTLIAMRRLQFRTKPQAGERRKLVDFLINEQLTERKGFKTANPDYGGWDLLAGSGARGVTSGTNVSVSSFVLEALQDETGAAAKRAKKLAAKWAAGCQNFPGDGGFYFHPQKSHLGNKALWTDKEGKHPRSYGTATCDGLHCFLSCRVPKSDKRLQSGLGWLKGHRSVKVVPGFEDAPKSLGWKEGLRYYYACRLAPLLPLLDAKDAAGRRSELMAVLLKAQRKDGSWKSESARMREDDPLIATCFAISALTELRKQQEKTK
jgi:hypothetical protein